MSSQEKEEIWLARIVMLLGAKELVDVLLNLCTLLKLRSGLPIISSNPGESATMAYLIAGVIAGIYLVFGGSALSRLAFGRAVPRANLYADTPLPDWPGCLGVAFRAFGAQQMIACVSSVALAVASHHRTLDYTQALAPRMDVVETAWALEHALIGFLLLSLGGKIARFFMGRKAPGQSQ